MVEMYFLIIKVCEIYILYEFVKVVFFWVVSFVFFMCRKCMSYGKNRINSVGGIVCY